MVIDLPLTLSGLWWFMFITFPFLLFCSSRKFQDDR
jgi:hypothetical protein